MTVPLYEGEPKPTAAQCTTQPGIKVTSLTWSGKAIQKMVIKDQYLVGDSCSLFKLADNPKVWINGVPYNADYSLIDTEFALTVTNKTIPTVPKGVTVSGTVTSYGDTGENVTVQLIEAGLTEPAYEAIVSGSSAAYSFPIVPAGEYTLKVMKKGHAPWTESITVESTAVTKDVTVYLYGDVNRNGKVTVLDVSWILQYLVEEKTFDEYQLLLADVNKSGNISVLDASWIRQFLVGSRNEYYELIN